MFSVIHHFILILFLTSCSYISLVTGGNPSENHFNKSQRKYVLKDKTGSFLLYREKGLSGNEKQFVVKRKIVESGENIKSKNILEQSVAISTKGLHEKKIHILTPKISEFSVWYDKKKYLSRIEFNKEEKNIKVTLKSPDPDWNGEKLYSLPKTGNGVYCFLSQLVECAAVTGFIKMAIKKGRGVMKFHLIWEGYPFIGEQYINLPNSPISKAELGYDGQNRLGEKRFKLNVENQSLLIFVDKDYQLSKLYWPAQGLSLQPESYK